MFLRFLIYKNEYVSKENVELCYNAIWQTINEAKQGIRDDEFEKVEDYFNDLFFNEERKAYTYTVVEGDYSGVISYYFKDGNLLSVDAEIMNIAGEVAYLDETIHIEIDFIDFTIITIPEHKVFEG